MKIIKVESIFMLDVPEGTLLTLYESKADIHQDDSLHEYEKTDLLDNFRNCYTEDGFIGSVIFCDDVMQVYDDLRGIDKFEII